MHLFRVQLFFYSLKLYYLHDVHSLNKQTKNPSVLRTTNPCSLLLCFIFFSWFSFHLYFIDIWLTHLVLFSILNFTSFTSNIYTYLLALLLRVLNKNCILHTSSSFSCLVYAPVHKTKHFSKYNEPASDRFMTQVATCQVPAAPAVVKLVQ